MREVGAKADNYPQNIETPQRAGACFFIIPSLIYLDLVVLDSCLTRHIVFDSKRVLESFIFSQRHYYLLQLFYQYAHIAKVVDLQYLINCPPAPM